ncbi:hypothetical protein KR222_005681 [Zaprionus bogoriensis]|nr:hypothetical protein KR222_005681 [Zaprionus bogoriensis]
MDFAKKILGKYGWKEGDGLGKNNSGIAAPLKASLKFDNAGLGVDRAKEFNDHWWERCFNEAASNVTVKVEQNGEVSTSRKAGEEAVEISTKGYSARKLKQAKEQQRVAGDGAVYEHFLKSALLTQDGGEVANQERIKAEDIAVTTVSVLTDEQLFEACGGRTAHKGARHGLKLSGKLARLEQQEREMLAQLQAKRSAAEQQQSETEQLKKKKKRRKEHNQDEAVDLELELQANAAEEQQTQRDKSKKKKRKHKVETEEEAGDAMEQDTELEKVKKKKRAEETAEAAEEAEEVAAAERAKEPEQTKKKKRSKHKTEEAAEPLEVATKDEEILPTEAKKQKRRKQQSEATEEAVQLEAQATKKKQRQGRERGGISS